MPIEGGRDGRPFPSSTKIVGMSLPSEATISSSVSRAVTPQVAASTSATVLFPEPGGPIRTALGMAIYRRFLGIALR